MFISKMIIDTFKGNKSKPAKISIEDAHLSARIYNALKRSGNYYLNDLQNMSFSELVKIRNIGRSGAEEIINACKEYGIAAEK